jgi:hypothetical protein
MISGHHAFALRGPCKGERILAAPRHQRRFGIVRHEGQTGRTSLRGSTESHLDKFRYAPSLSYVTIE